MQLCSLQCSVLVRLRWPLGFSLGLAQTGTGSDALPSSAKTWCRTSGACGKTARRSRSTASECSAIDADGIEL